MGAHTASGDPQPGVQSARAAATKTRARPMVAPESVEATSGFRSWLMLKAMSGLAAGGGPCFQGPS